MVTDADSVDISVSGEPHSIPVADVLDRSGVAVLRNDNATQRKYRFEPLWMHRLLVETEPVATAGVQ